MQDTKKLNAGIALVCLGVYLGEGLLSEDQVKIFVELAPKCCNTPLNQEGYDIELEYINQAINLIEEYLKEQEA